jgi:aldehyde dehydrogenase (NAD+)
MVLWLRSIQEALVIASDVSYGLAAVWTREIGAAHRLASQIKTGQIFINNFGGYKKSGFGHEKGIKGVL